MVLGDMMLECAFASSQNCIMSTKTPAQKTNSVPKGVSTLDAAMLKLKLDLSTLFLLPTLCQAFYVIANKLAERRKEYFRHRWDNEIRSACKCCYFEDRLGMDGM